MFGYRRSVYGPGGPQHEQRGCSLVGCGCGGLGMSLLLSALATLFANLFTRRF